MFVFDIDAVRRAREALVIFAPAGGSAVARQAR